MTTQTVPVRLNATHQRHLEELQQFWGDNASDAIRRALETEHELMTISLRADEEAVRGFGVAHFMSVRERYQIALRELRARTTELRRLEGATR